MKSIREIKLIDKTDEELLPDFSPDFPYIASRAELDKYIENGASWHWHRTVELFYIESGSLEYATPNAKQAFYAGSGGFINSNVLHSSKVIPSGRETIQLLHLFEPELLCGTRLGRIDEKYIRPLTASGIEMIVLSPDDAHQAAILQKIRATFDLQEEQWGYEFRLRANLDDIWLSLLELSRSLAKTLPQKAQVDEKLKAMLRYIQLHYAETISVNRLAEEAHVSRRACFRLFRENLHTTPLEYITEYRLNKACLRLTDGNETITQIAYGCGLGSSSYFGKIFRSRFGCTPAKFRKDWHDHNRISHK